jgi:hypothetical protein
MEVQKVRFPQTNRSSWIVLGDDFLPVKPILVFLKFMENLGRSPNTVRSAAHHLKLFWEYLRDECLNWKEVDLAHLAAFISWLRDPQPSVVFPEIYKAQRTDATIDQILTTVHVLYVKRDYLWYTTRTDDLIKERYELAGDQLGLLSPRTSEPDHAGLHRTAGSRTKISKYR